MDVIVEFNEAAFRHGISKEDIFYALKTKIYAAAIEEFMARMTEEEVIAVSDYFINNKVTLGPNGSDWLSQREMRAWGLEDKTINYILKRAMADHIPPARIIDELVSKELAKAV